MKNCCSFRNQLSIKLMTIVILSVACGLTACNVMEPKVTFDKELLHDNGLMVSRPRGFSDKKTKTGFVFSELGERRTPRIITVDKTYSPPKLVNASEYPLGTQIAHYRITDIGSASGGTEYELNANKSSGNAYIVIREVSQVEGNAPEFTIGWAILLNARSR